MTDKERIEKIIKDTFDVIQKVYHTQREGDGTQREGDGNHKDFCESQSRISFPNTVSNIVIVKLASASKS